MPVLSLSELNIVLSVLGTFILFYAIISVKIKQAWYLGEALPAVVFGVALGPIAAQFIESEKWGSATPGQTSAITLGVTRVMIGVQLVIAGYQLPAKYCITRWKEMALCLLPVMTVMWLCTSACVMVTIPNITFLAALVIASCVTCIDPILSQEIAKGPFADKFVPRPLREIISAEAGANEGFGFLFLMLATYLIRHADVPGAGTDDVAARSAAEIGQTATHALIGRSDEVGRLGGGVAHALETWFVETWLYVFALSIAYGFIVGYGACKAIKLGLKHKYIDDESYVLFPTTLGLFIVGSCGAIGTDDLLACFAAGCALNWDGNYLRETESRHDQVNACITILLNFSGFMYIGAILPWESFHDPTGTGITLPRLFGLGFLVLVFRRLPAILTYYKAMPAVCKSWKDALFMGYFGPIGAGAVFYVEHARQLFPQDGEGDEEETNLVRALAPTVYWLVLFSIVIHGLSIPALNLFYHFTRKEMIKEDAVEVHRASMRVATPNNAIAGDNNTFIAFNRFSRQVGSEAPQLPVQKELHYWSDDEQSINEASIEKRKSVLN
ncbi:unnamed protein product [Fusarium graminearum]|nr:unnamed protein product [Fusarium graminearum]CAG1973487.1 unnamed protein product [Fusarium graminearum]CZS73545.1 unnamed protein product [Fusarium graminearum]VTO88822.1 unnamed protein product [Fusarium graminearum]